MKEHRPMPTALPALSLIGEPRRRRATLEKAHGQRLTAKEVSDAAMRDGVHANFEMDWSGPDGVVIDISHTKIEP
jgi:hypothetical protein